MDSKMATKVTHAEFKIFTFIFIDFRGTSSGSKEDLWKVGQSLSSESKNDFQ